MFLFGIKMTDLHFLLFKELKTRDWNKRKTNPFDGEVEVILLKVLWVEILKTSSMHI